MFYAVNLSRRSKWARTLLRAAQDQGDASFQYLGHSVCSRSFFVLGAFTEARSHGIAALDLYNPAYREQLASLTAEDPQCATLAFSALVLFCLGYLDQASNSSQRCHDYSAVGRRGSRYCLHPRHRLLLRSVDP